MKNVLLIFDHFLLKTVQSLDLVSIKKKDNYIKDASLAQHLNMQGVFGQTKVQQ